MAEWKTDTKEVKQIVKKCRDFKGSLQEEKCAQFIKNLDKYALEILLEHRKIELQLQGAIEELRKAKKKQGGFFRSVFRGIRGACDFFSNIPIFKPVAKLGAKACDKALNLMEEDTKKYEKNVIIQLALSFLICIMLTFFKTISAFYHKFLKICFL
ncbi:hypothetical protein ID0094_02460 [Helicobacter pylori]